MLRGTAAVMLWAALCLSVLTGPSGAEEAQKDILIADFEGKDHGAWKVEGEAFGPGPARGTLPRHSQGNEPHITGEPQ